MIPPLVDTALQSRDPARVLTAVIAVFGCDAGTLHVLRDGVLMLAHAHNIPPTLVEVVATIPLGKGLAGLAASRREPVSLCNLQTDESGLARPGARLTGMEGSVAVPLLVNGDLCGVLGIALAAPREWTGPEQALLLAIGTRLGALVRS